MAIFFAPKKTFYKNIQRFFMNKIAIGLLWSFALGIGGLAVWVHQYIESERDPIGYKILKEIRGNPDFTNEDRSNSIVGIDANNDGIRDDIEHYIKKVYADKPDYRNRLLDLAKHQRMELGLKSDQDMKYKLLRAQKDQKTICISILGHKYGYDIQEIDHQLMTIAYMHINTEARMQESVRIGHMFNGYNPPVKFNTECKNW